MKRAGSVATVANFMRRKSLELVLGGSSDDKAAWLGAAAPADPLSASEIRDRIQLPSNFFGLSCKDAKGNEVGFEKYRGRPSLVVNVASA